ncbi:hypothetical protein F5141DRAFT_1276105 [Pisolithus sp. B1]|nr:hypothetical protein F5141DRAFT_1276105 [Pisolithus sp. B1]
MNGLTAEVHSNASGEDGAKHLTSAVPQKLPHHDRRRQRNPPLSASIITRLEDCFRTTDVLWVHFSDRWTQFSLITYEEVIVWRKFGRWVSPVCAATNLIALAIGLAVFAIRFSISLSSTPQDVNSIENLRQLLAPKPAGGAKLIGLVSPSVRRAYQYGGGAGARRQGEIERGPPHHLGAESPRDTRHMKAKEYRWSGRWRVNGGSKVTVYINCRTPFKTGGDGFIPILLIRNIDVVIADHNKKCGLIELRLNSLRSGGTSTDLC